MRSILSKAQLQVASNIEKGSSLHGLLTQKTISADSGRDSALLMISLILRLNLLRSTALPKRFGTDIPNLKSIPETFR